MSPYKKFIASVKEYFESVPVLKTVLNLHAAVFGAGGVLYLLGAFLINTIWSSLTSLSGGLSGLVLYDVFTALGVILIWTGLLLCIIAEDDMITAIISAFIAVGSLVAWIVALAGVKVLGYHIGLFLFEPLLYFLLFAGVAVLIFLKSEKFREMRASSARPAGVTCPRCGGFIPVTAAFCPQCAAPNPGPPQYAPPAAPQYAPPQYAPPAAPQYAPPQYAAPAAPQYAPPQYAAPAAPQYAPPVPPVVPQPEPAPAAPVTEEPATAQNACKSCGAELPAGAVFCGKCGAHQ